VNSATCSNYVGHFGVQSCTAKVVHFHGYALVVMSKAHNCPCACRYAALDVFAVQYIMRTLPLKHGVKAFEAAANMQGCLESHPVGAYERSQPKAQSPTKKVKLAAAAAGLCSFGVLLWPWATGLCVMSHQ
jgi:hypothetical protein